MRRSVGILGTPIDIMNTEEVLASLEAFIQEGGFHQVATANTDFVINALADPELGAILRRADVVTPDGMPIVWASRLLGSPLPERVTGADIVPLIAARAVRNGWRIFLLGARPEIGCLAGARLQADFPGIEIVGILSPAPARLEALDDNAILAHIRAAAPDILLVAFGNPKQEKWIHRNRESLGQVAVCIGVGGTLDYLANKRSRAPLWMQRRGLEWLYRLLQEPGRLGRRYSRDFHQFGVLLSRQVWAMRRCGRGGPFSVKSVEMRGRELITLRGEIRGGANHEIGAFAGRAFAAGRGIVFDLSGVDAVDGEFLGMLIECLRIATERGVEVHLVSIPARIESVLNRARLLGTLFTAGLTLGDAVSGGSARAEQEIRREAAPAAPPHTDH